MKLDVLFKEKPCVFALEVFPPKKASGLDNLYDKLDAMGQLPIDYISVTYSAGGSGNSAYTAQISQHLKQHDTLPLAHLTCAGSTQSDTASRIDALKEGGIQNILALRGDKQPDAPMGDFGYASDLIEFIRKNGDFYIAAACYPEGHPESPTLASDIDMLKRKLDAGAGHFVSQLFFDNGKYFRFLNLARKKGIQCPVEAGVMPIVRTEQITRTVSLSSASLPAEFSKMVTNYGHDPESFYKAGLEYAIMQIRDLIESGVDGIHLYAMNNVEVAQQIYTAVEDLL